MDSDSRDKFNIILSSQTPLYLPLAMAWINLPKTVRERFNLEIMGKKKKKMRSKRHIIVGDPWRDYTSSCLQYPTDEFGFLKEGVVKGFPVLNKLALILGECTKADGKDKIFLSHKKGMTTNKVASFLACNTSEYVWDDVEPGFERIYFDIARYKFKEMILKNPEEKYTPCIIMPDTFATGHTLSNFCVSSLPKHEDPFLTTAMLINESDYEEYSLYFDELKESYNQICKNIQQFRPEYLEKLFDSLRKELSAIEWNVLLYDISDILDIFERWNKKNYFNPKSFEPDEIKKGITTSTTMDKCTKRNIDWI